jgi:hypothetical protein
VNQTLERIAHSHNELAFEKEEKVVQSEYRRRSFW